jgi:short-subunit dehydrogenase
MELELNGKVALVTGANRGIRAVIATELAREGVHLCLVARDPAKLQEVACTLRRAHNIDVEVLSADMRDPAAPLHRDKLLRRQSGISVAWTCW